MDKNSDTSFIDYINSVKDGPCERDKKATGFCPAIPDNQHLGKVQNDISPLGDLTQLHIAGLDNMDCSDESEKFQSLVKLFKEDLIYFVTESQTLLDAKERLDTEFQAALEELHREQRRYEQLQSSHKEQVHKLQEKIMMAQQESEDKLRGNEREKERLNAQILQAKEESRCTHEQQRTKIVELMSMRGQLEKMEKDLKQEMAAKKLAESNNSKVSATIRQITEELQKAQKMMSQLESNVKAANEINQNMRSYLNYQNNLLESHKRCIAQLTKEKEQLRAQVAELETKNGSRNISDDRVKLNSDEEERKLAKIFLETLLEEKSLLQSSEQSCRQQLKQADQTIQILRERALMVDEKDRELFEIRSKMIEMSKALKTSQVRMDKEIPNCQIEEEAEVDQQPQEPNVDSAESDRTAVESTNRETVENPDCPTPENESDKVQNCEPTDENFPNQISDAKKSLEPIFQLPNPKVTDSLWSPFSNQNTDAVSALPTTDEQTSRSSSTNSKQSNGDETSKQTIQKSQNCKEKPRFSFHLSQFGKNNETVEQNLLVKDIAIPCNNNLDKSN